MIVSGIIEEQAWNVTEGWQTHRSLGHYRVIGAEFLCANESPKTSFRYIAKTDVEIFKFDNDTLLRKIVGKDLSRNLRLTSELIERQRLVIECLAREAHNAGQDRDRIKEELTEENQLFLAAIKQLNAEIAYSQERRREGARLLRLNFEERIKVSSELQTALSEKDKEIATLKARIKSLEEASSGPAPNALPPDALGLIMDSLNNLGDRLNGVDQKVTKIQQGVGSISEQFRVSTRFVADLIRFLAATPRNVHTQLLLPATEQLLQSDIPAAQQVGMALQGLILQTTRPTTKKPS